MSRKKAPSRAPSPAPAPEVTGDQPGDGPCPDGASTRVITIVGTEVDPSDVARALAEYREFRVNDGSPISRAPVIVYDGDRPAIVLTTGADDQLGAIEVPAIDVRGAEPEAPWRSFKLVCTGDPSDVSLVEGRGVGPEQAISEAMAMLKRIAADPMANIPDARAVVEGDRLWAIVKDTGFRRF